MISYIKQHKLVTLLFLVICYLLFRGSTLFSAKSISMNPVATDSYAPTAMRESGGFNMGVSKMAAGIMPPIQDYPPSPQVKDRMVIQDSSLSLLVSDVRKSIDEITSYAKQAGGYMVTSSLSNPGESPTATVIIRVPSLRLSATLQMLRSSAIRVMAEDLTGQDITDQYVDNDTRLATLMATKEKFQAIFDRSVEISDILNIQRELINLQSQIDSIKGQQQYLRQAAETSKITIQLSTDELALQYNPSDAWRPSVIFKEAVRSLILHGRMIIGYGIYIGVYSIIWIPLLIIFLISKKKMKLPQS